MNFTIFKMTLIFSRLWRTRKGMLISIGINVILVMLLLRSYVKNNNIVRNEFDVSRREMQSQHVSLLDRDTSKQQKAKRISDHLLFILILSSPNGYERRKTIRETWLQLQIGSDVNIGHKFIIGTYGLKNEVLVSLIKEREQHNDLLLLGNHEDNYYSLTAKLLKTFIWIKDNVHSNFILKVDDDSFVRTNVLVKDLENRKNTERIYWGFFRGDANVKKTGKWAEKHWILCDKYLPYANGGGYLLSQDLVNYIAKTSTMLQIYNNEDVAVGAWLAPVLLNRIHDLRFDTEYKSRGCNNKHIISHKQSINDMYKKYRELKLNNRLCKVEFSARRSFDYNWNVEPSML